MKYKLDRSTFAMGSDFSKEPPKKYWKNKTPEERLEAAYYLNSVAFNFNLSEPPKLDRTFFKMGKTK